MKKRFNGRMMAQVRRAAGMDQAELALRVSRNRVTISDIERGKLQPGRELSQRLAKELKLELASLYTVIEEQVAPGAVRMTIEELQVVDAMRRMGPIGRAKIWAFAQGLAAGGGSDGATAAAELAEAIEVSSRNGSSLSDSQADSA